MKLSPDLLNVKIYESDIAPNRYAARALLLLLVGVFAACMLNEVGVFEVSHTVMWSCFGLSALVSCVVEFFVRNQRYVAARCTKYVVIVASLLLTCVISVLLSNIATLLLLLPMLLVTQYRSMRLTRIACIGACLISILAPVGSWYAHAWGLKYLTGYLETTCRVSILGFGPANLTEGQSIGNILMYISLPQGMIMAVFGATFSAVAKNNIRGLEDRLRAMQLDQDLNRELDHVVSMQDQILYSIADIVENRDVATGDHVKRTSEIVRMLVDAMRRDPALHLSDSFCASVVKAAPLHDIGKIAVDDAILRKPGPLNEDETRVMRLHPVKSAELIHKVLDGLEDAEFLAIAENLALYHHEWFDGSGYPAGLKGTDIPLEARIMSIADVFDALVSRRSYKRAFPLDEAFRIMHESMGSQFDPALEKYCDAVRFQIEEYYKSQAL